MTDESRDATVRLSAEVDPYRREVALAAEDTNKLGIAVDKLSAKLDGLSKRAGKKLALFGAGAGAGILGVTKEAATFEKQMSTLNATAAITDKTLGGFTKNVTGLTRQFPIARGEAVQLVTTLDKLGVSSTKNIGIVSESMVKLSHATGEGVIGLTTQMVELGKQMGTLSSGSMAQYANSLLVVSKQSGVAAGGVLSFAAAIAPTARAAGLSEQAVLGVSAAFTKAGADGYAAANTFSTMLADITRQVVTGSPEIAKYSNLIGVTADQFKKMDKAEALAAVFEAINKQGPEAIKTLDRLGYDGVRTMKSIQAVSQSGGLREAIATATGAYSSTGQLEDASQAAMGGLSDSMLKTKSAMEQLATTAGGPFAAAFGPVVDTFTQLLQVLNVLAGPLAAVGASLSGILAAGALTLGGGMIMSKFNNLVAMGSYVAKSGPVQAARGGFVAGRGLANSEVRTNEATRAARTAPAGMGWWQRPFYSAAVGVGDAMGPDSGQSAWRRFGGAALTSPLRTASFLAGAQADFYRDARRSGFDRQAPVLRGLGSVGNAAMHPLAFLGGLRQGSGALSGAGGAKDAAEFADKLKLGTTAMLARTATEKSGMRVSQQAAAATGTLAKAFLRLEAQLLMTSATTVGRGAFGAAKGLATGALGLVGGPAGAAVLGAGLVGYGMYGQHKAQQESMDTDGSASLDKYNVALGIATSELGTFAGAVKSAYANLPKADQLQDVLTISREVIQLARAPKRELLNQQVKNYTTTEARAAYINSLGITDPRQLQAVQADLIQTSNVGAAQAAVDMASSQRGTDYGALLRGVSAKQSGSLFSKARVGFVLGAGKGSGTSRDMVRDVFDDIQYKQAGDAKLNNAEYAGQVAQNEMLKVLSAATSEKAISTPQGKATANQALKAYEDRILGEQRTGLDVTAFGDIKSPRARARAITDYLSQDANSGARAAYNERDYLPGIATGSQLGGLKVSADSALVRGIKGAGGIGDFALKDKTVQNAAFGETANVNEQYQATQGLVAEATKLGGSFAGADKELQKLKAGINDVTSPLYKMASAAQQFNLVAAQNAQVFMSRSELRTAQVATHKNVLNEDPNATDHQQRVTDDRAAANAAIASDYERGKAIVMAHRNFAIQVKRIDEDRYLTTMRAEEDFNLQMSQASADHQRSLDRGARDFGIGMLQATEDFHTSRYRQERDFNKSMVRMAEDAAKGFYDPWRRVYSEYTSDVGTLLQNLEDQNQKLGEQNANLGKVSSMGLSAQSIETLGLADPKNAQQLERLVLDLIQDPSMVAKINAQVAARLASSGELAQSKFSTAFKRTKEDFAQGLEDAENDFARGQRRAKNAHGRMLADMAQDWSTQMARATDAHERMLKRMNQDNATQTRRALEDLARLNEEVTGSFESVMGRASRLVKKNLNTLGNSTLRELRQMNAAYLSLMETMGLGGGRSHREVHSGGPGRETYTTSTAPKIGKAVQTLMESYGWIEPTSAPKSHAAGGIATRMQGGIFGEAGPEALIPLGPRGHDFIAGMYKEISRSLVKDMGAVPSSVAYRGGAGTVIDASNNFNGPITVEASDPNEMARELAAKARVAKLTRPNAGSRA